MDVEGFKNLVQAHHQVAAMKPTFCGLIAAALGKGFEQINGVTKYDRRHFEITQSFYNASGVQATVRDTIDGREYTVTITPNKVEP